MQGCTTYHTALTLSSLKAVPGSTCLSPPQLLVPQVQGHCPFPTPTLRTKSLDTYQGKGCCGTWRHRGSGGAWALGCTIHTHLGHSLLPSREGSCGHDADGASRVALAVQLTISHLDYSVCHLQGEVEQAMPDAGVPAQG